MKERMRQWMLGRYGLDPFGQFLNVAALILLVLGMIFADVLTTFAFALIIYHIFRMFSRNIVKRSRENESYLSLRQRLSGIFRSSQQQVKQRKTHRFYRCPSCRQQLRVPKGKGKINITCSTCGTAFERKS